MSYFEAVHDEVFVDDPAANPAIEVEVVGIGMAADTPVVVLIAPWTLCGLALPPHGGLPDSLRIGHRHHPVLANVVDEIGSYYTVVLVPDVSGYLCQEDIRTAAVPLADQFRMAVQRAREEMTQVADGDRRALLKAASMQSAPATKSRTAFGDPDDMAPVGAPD